MTKTRRQFSPEEKHSILQEAEREGYSQTCRKYNLATSLLALWKKKYLLNGKDGLKPSYHRVDPKVRELEEENVRLKKIIAKQALEMEVKDELLKKSHAHSLKEKKW